MAKKEITTVFKIQAPGGQATPAPPIGPALGQNGVNPGQFIQRFNEATRALNGKVVGCVITVYKDRTFEFEIRQPPNSVILKDLIKADKGSGEPNKNKIGKITKAQLRQAVEAKGKEMTAHDTEAAMRTMAGTARSMGIDVVD